MKGIIINHGTRYIKELQDLFNECDTIEYKDFRKEIVEKYDYVVLSGGPTPVIYEIEEEKKWLKETNKPIFGICLGLQILCLVYDDSLEYKKLDKNRKTNENFKFVNENYSMHYNHSYYFDHIPKDFIGELKYSKTRNVNILTYIRHKNKPILAFQGHPEITKNSFLIKNLFLNEMIKK